MLNDVLAAFGRIQGVGSGEDADEDEAEAASEVPDLGNEDDEDDEDAIDELAPVDADTEILRGLIWSDPTFPANGISLGFRNDVDEGRGPESRAWADVAWTRCGALFDRCRLFKDTPSPFDVVQGGLGDCYLLSALCVLAERPARIYRLFETTELNKAGLVGARLYLHGEERLVLVDDQLPTRNGALLFAKSRTDGELWVSMFEKAFAKAYGSYANIELGSTARTLETLTGAPSTVASIRGRDTKAADAMWERIHGGLEKGHVVCLGVGDHPQDLQKLVGIVEKHAYACVGSAEVQGARLVRIRNPWADGTEWRGKWSDEDENWTPELRRGLDHGVAADGVFWMAIEDVVGIFDDVVVCAVDDHARYCHSPRAALPDAKTRLLAFELRPLRSAHVVVTCRQPDKRDDDATGYHALRAAVYRLPDTDSPAAKRIGASGGDDHTYMAGRDVVAADATLHSGRSYLVVVETYEDREREGPLDGTCVVSTYGGAPCAIAPLAPKQGDLAQATCALAFARFAKDARESNLGDGARAAVTLRKWSRQGESLHAMIYANASEGLVLMETATFALENCHVHRATLDADADTVVALTAIDPVVKVTLVPGASTLLLIRKDPDAQSSGFSYRRAFRLRGR